MSGRGTFRWASGERYDGQWLDGREEGRGTFTWPDGSYFDGNWAAGEKHGMGMWAPPLAGPADGAAPDAPREALLREYDRGALVREERVPAQQRPVGDPVAGRPAVKTRKVRQVRMGETIFKGAPSYDLMLQLQLGIRWSVGRITPEKPREIGDIDFRLNSPLAAVSARFPRGGSSTTPPHASHDFKWKDYCPMVRTHRLRAVSFSQQLLSLNCTQVFRKLRERFGIDAGEYMLSLCGACACSWPATALACADACRIRTVQATRRCASCHRPANPAASFSCRRMGASSSRRCGKQKWHGGRSTHVCGSARPDAARASLQTHLSRVVLRDYYAHVLQYPDTLLTRFFGLHRVKPHGGRNVRFVVMGNLLCTGHKIHRRYDLKGSTYGRITEAPYDAGKKILKDLDIEYTFQLDDGYAARLTAQLDADCRLLQRLNIMDYSLLLGVHFQTRRAGRGARGHARTRPAADAPPACLSSGTNGSAAATEAGRQGRPSRERSLSALLASRAPGKPKEGEEEDDDDDDDFDGDTNTHLGENMTALAIPGRVLKAPKGVEQLPLPTERASVILNFGVIDILQEYNMSKQIEHSWKVRLATGRALNVACFTHARRPARCSAVRGAAAAEHLLRRPDGVR